MPTNENGTKTTAKRTTAKTPAARKTTSRKPTAKKANREEGNREEGNREEGHSSGLAAPRLAGRSAAPRTATPLVVPRHRSGAGRQRGSMKARQGDLIVIDSAHVGSPPREGEVLQGHPRRSEHQLQDQVDRWCPDPHLARCWHRAHRSHVGSRSPTTPRTVCRERERGIGLLMDATSVSEGRSRELTGIASDLVPPLVSTWA